MRSIFFCFPSILFVSALRFFWGFFFGGKLSRVFYNFRPEHYCRNIIVALDHPFVSSLIQSFAKLNLHFWGGFLFPRLIIYFSSFFVLTDRRR